MKIKLIKKTFPITRTPREIMDMTCDECRKRFDDGEHCFNKSCGYYGASESVLKWKAIRHEQDEQNDIKAGKY